MAMLSGCWERVWTCGPGMPSDWLRPKVAVYSLIWRVRLAAATTSPQRESTLSKSPSILRSFSILCSSYDYSLHYLYHLPAGLLAVPVYDLVVELVARRYLFYGCRHPAFDRLGGLGSPAFEAPAGLLQRRSPDEDHHRVGTALLDLPSPLELDPEYDGAAAVKELLHALLRCTVEVARVLSPFEQAILLCPPLELFAGEKDVVPTVHLALARFPGRGGGNERELRYGSERGLDQGVLAGPRGPGDDDQFSSQPRTLIKRSRWPWVRPTRVLDRLIPASLITRLTVMRPIPLTERGISSTLAPLSSSGGSMSRS